MSDDGFIDLVPPEKFSGKPAAVILKTFKLRSASRMSISISDELFEAIGRPENVAISYNPQQFAVRIKADTKGAFKLTTSAKAKLKRWGTKIQLPTGILVGKKEPGPYVLKGSAIIITIPTVARDLQAMAESSASGKAIDLRNGETNADRLLVRTYHGSGLRHSNPPSRDGG